MKKIEMFDVKKQHIAKKYMHRFNRVRLRRAELLIQVA